METASQDFEDKIKVYKKKTLPHAQNLKKIRALVNYSYTISHFDDWCALEFIIRHFAKGFLADEEEGFLDYILKKYGIDYTQWCQKTPWVKNQIAAAGNPIRKPQQLYFWFPDYEQKKVEGRYVYPLYSKLEKYKQIKLEAL